MSCIDENGLKFDKHSQGVKSEKSQGVRPAFLLKMG